MEDDQLHSFWIRLHHVNHESAVPIYQDLQSPDCCETRVQDEKQSSRVDVKSDKWKREECVGTRRVEIGRTNARDSAHQRSDAAAIVNVSEMTCDAHDAVGFTLMCFCVPSSELEREA